MGRAGVRGPVESVGSGTSSGTGAGPTGATGGGAASDELPSDRGGSNSNVSDSFFDPLMRLLPL